MELGKKQKLVVVKTVDFGVYLGDRQDAGETDRVLLPGKEVPEGTGEGDTMKVYHYLKTNSPYIVGDMVTGVVYEQSDNFGVFVAVDGQYSGLIPKQEAQGNYKVGEELTFRVTQVREDGKLNLSAKQKAHIQLHEDAQSVYEIIQDFEGVLPFDDKASPEIIQREFGLSKNAFKRAVGHLLKEEKIELKNHKIYIR